VAHNESSDLGEALKAARELRGKSLKAVAEPAEISSAYLLKLERGEVASPSPHVLHRLAQQLGLDYRDLMRLAGYVVPDSKPQRAGALAQALSAQNLTEDEARAVAAFLKTYRSTGRG
jgi:HTH-type transcriptional regulator, competence development regulator